MNNYIIYYSFIYLLLCFNNLDAQPNYIYEGGSGGGFISDEVEFTNIILFKGANGSGYSSIDLVEINLSLYRGGSDDGYSSVRKSDIQENTYFEGGNGDGYTISDKYEDFIWTGVSGTGWMTAANWNYNIVPDIKRRVIIPSGVPNFPFVNAGIFAIGQNPNDGAFTCGQLWIQEDAYLVTRINNSVENYGSIIIDGTIQVKKASVDAFQNFGEGIVRINSLGTLLIKP